MQYPTLTKRSSRWLTLALLALPLLGVSVNAAENPAAPLTQTATANISARADSLIAREEFAAYRGWLKYLEFRVKFDAEKFGPASKEAAESLARLEDWTTRIEADPALIGKLRGVQEWAYESTADGSGQPFRINIPTDYDPAKPTAASLYCHGYSGTHIEHTTFWKDKTGNFDVAVLGRARGGFYVSLSEKDVLDVVSYIKAHWNVDANRLSLNGGSMGGHSSFWLGARHPDLWSSISPSCGFAFREPLDNLRQTPVYSLHSKDDPVVSIALDDGPLKHLIDIGGKVTYEETNGFGHAVWDFKEGNTRAGEWAARQVRPDPTEVRTIDYTALDSVANGAWWAYVTEWGPKNRPAHFILNVGADNTLYVRADNIAKLRIDREHSPIDPARDLHISVNGAIAFTLAAPIPASIELANGSSGWQVAGPESALPYRLHTPGGASTLYDGTPLLIVYGTQGSPEENAAILTAATAASRSPNASWPDDEIDRSPTDRVSHYQNLYGELNVKADKDVTSDDIARCNLVIIGTEKENSLAAKLTGKLPAKFDAGKIVIADGTACDAKENALGLAYYNPENPERLVLWFASENSAFYSAARLLPQIMSIASGADLVVMGAESSRVVAARSFDSRWNFNGQDGALIPEALCDEKSLAVTIAGAIRDESHADFGLGLRTLSTLKRTTPALSATPGITRYGDIARLYYFTPVYKVTLSGTQLVDMMAKRDASQERTFEISNNFDASTLVPTKNYTIAVIEEDLWALLAASFLPDNSEWTGVQANDAILAAGE